MRLVDMSLTANNGASQNAWWLRAPAIILDVAVLTALLYFCGMARTDATFRVLNVQLSMLRLDPVTYIYRGMLVLVPALLVLGLSIVVVIAAHRLVLRFLANQKSRTIARQIVRTIACLALLVSGVGLILTVNDDGHDWWMPCMLAASCAALALGDRSFGGKAADDARSTGTVTSVLVMLCALAVFMAVVDYAHWFGRQVGQHALNTAQDQPSAVVYSTEWLGIVGPGVKPVPVVVKGSKFRICYTGLVLIIRNGDEYLFVPQGIDPAGNRPVFVVPKEGVRLDLGTGGGCTSAEQTVG